MIIRKAKLEDESQIIDICYSSRDKEEFPDVDKKIFALRWALYYLRFQTSFCFVAEDNGKIIGYVLATPDTYSYETEYVQKVIPVIKDTISKEDKDYFKYTSFEKDSDIIPEVIKQYPAHLHINLTAECRGRGIGSKLLSAMEDNLIKNNVSGIHLGVMEENQKAVSFYKKNNYTTVQKKLLGKEIGYCLFMGKTLI